MKGTLLIPIPQRASLTRYGARLIDSMPPARTTSAEPARIMSDANITACSPEPHTLLTVTAPTRSGRPANSAAWRAGFCPRPAEVIRGNVISAGLGQNPARQAALFAGLPDRVGAVTVNKVCGSGLQAVMFASDMIRAGSADVVLAGGMESMSRAPYLVKEARWGVGINNVPFIDAMIQDGLWDAYNQFHMGVTGEIVAERFKISREDMDRFALESHRRAAFATQEGRFKEQI